MVLNFIKNTPLLFVIVVAIACISCGTGNKDKASEQEELVIHDTVEISSFKSAAKLKEGANRFDQYKNLLSGKTIGLVGNQTSVVQREGDVVHLVDFLLSKEIALKKVFSPEHGFRGKADAGEKVQDGVDSKTGLPIFSLHGANKKPTLEQMVGLDVMVFDIQDVGVRFYTYLSTLHYVMEACAEAGIPMIVLDRPNPNAHYVDGPMMESKNFNFLGLHPVPLVYGMTIGEYAQMINGEGWLKGKVQCDLTVIPVENYTHNTPYRLAIRPSPNLPNDVAINLYPSLGLIEGTELNAGRGTEMQFQIFGSPDLPTEFYPFTYTPEPNFGSKYPKHKGNQCNGLDLRNTPRLSRVDLTWIIEAYTSHQNKGAFFNTKNFTAHAGNEVLQQQIEQGYTFKEIRKTWIRDLEAFKEIRNKYLIYD